MTDDDTARLRALAQAAHRAEDERAEAALRGDIDGLRRSNETRLSFRAAASPDVLLRLLDALDEARRERDEAKRDARELRFLWEQRGERANKAEDERDAAMALLKKHGIDYEP